MAEQTDDVAAPAEETGDIENLAGETPPADPPGDDGEVIVTIGETPPPAEEEDETKAAPWVRELRKTNREQARKIRELEQKAVPAPANDPAALPKPTLEACDYDADDYERKYDAWKAQQSQAAEAKRKKDEAEQAERDAWQSKVASYDKAKAELKVPDFDDAEEAVKAVLSVTQQAIIVSGAKNKAALIYAIGKNEGELKKLAAIKDNVEFAWAAAQLESKMSITPRKVPPPPERRIGGTSGVGGSADQNLDKLRAEAAKTGNMDKVIEYKRQQKAKAA